MDLLRESVDVTFTSLSANPRGLWPCSVLLELSIGNCLYCGTCWNNIDFYLISVFLVTGRRSAPTGLRGSRNDSAILVVAHHRCKLRCSRPSLSPLGVTSRMG